MPQETAMQVLSKRSNPNDDSPSVNDDYENNVNNHFGFLDLPRELRDIIYGHCLRDVTGPILRRGISHGGTHRIYRTYRHDILYTIRRAKWLRTCTQMRTEGKSALARTYVFHLSEAKDLVLAKAVLGQQFTEIRSLALSADVLRVMSKLTQHNPKWCVDILVKISKLAHVAIDYYCDFEYIEGGVEELARRCRTIKSLYIEQVNPWSRGAIHCHCKYCKYFYTRPCDTTMHNSQLCPSCKDKMSREDARSKNKATMQACQERINKISAPRLRQSNLLSITTGNSHEIRAIGE